MMKAKLFVNGRSQAVRLPKEYRFDGEDVLINKVGNMVFLIPHDDPWSGFMAGLDMFSEDYFETGRNQPEQQRREDL